MIPFEPVQHSKMAATSLVDGLREVLYYYYIVPLAESV